MSERLQTYRNLVTDRQDAWKTLVGIPYLAAYDQAYKLYQDTVTAQKDADKAQAELFVTAASVVIGSTLLATVASASMQKIASRSIVAFASKNLDLTMVKLLNNVRHTKSVTFAIGKFFEEVKSGITKEAQDIATRWSQANIDFVTATPFSQGLQVEQILTNNRLCAFAIAERIETHGKMSQAEKDHAFASLRRAPLAQMPTPRPVGGKGTLAEKIELAFYLAAVLDSETLVDWPASMNNLGPAGMTCTDLGTARSHPITQMPSSPGYPHPAAPSINGWGSTPAFQSVAIERAGGKVQERSNKLCVQMFGKPLYGRGSLFGILGPDDTDKPAELRTAEVLLTQLAIDTRPATPTDARR